MPKYSSVLIFGSSGAIGSSICNWFLAAGWHVTGITRKSYLHARETDRLRSVIWDPFLETCSPPSFEGCRFDAVVWAQGKNLNDGILNVDISAHEDMYRANVTYIIHTLQYLLQQDYLAQPSRLCVISSIWQNIARQNKLSYTVSKSALHGLVQSLMIDLGPAGHLINAVLPGALDTEMTRNNLTHDQIHILEQASPLGALPMLDDVCNLVGFLCSSSNTGITGQFIAADRGFSNARIL